MTIICSELEEDKEVIYQVHKLAFGRVDEAKLVNRLRGLEEKCLSFVAVEQGRVVGHLLFSPVFIEAAKETGKVLGLGPVGVLPEYQRRGIGSRLIRHGLRECRRQGCVAVVVVGDPDFYKSFGFSSARARGLRCEFSVPDEVFMVTELVPRALAGKKGLVRYRPEFYGA